MMVTCRISQKTEILCGIFLGFRLEQIDKEKFKVLDVFVQLLIKNVMCSGQGSWSRWEEGLCVSCVWMPLGSPGATIPSRFHGNLHFLIVLRPLGMVCTDLVPVVPVRPARRGR